MFFYPLETGSYWEGEIENANITLKLKNIDVIQLTTLKPGNFAVINEDTVTWTFKDFEPTKRDNIEVYCPLLHDPKMIELVGAPVFAAREAEKRSSMHKQFPFMNSPCRTKAIGRFERILLRTISGSTMTFSKIILKNLKSA
ncbi:MAG: hypothetical protein ISS63_14915 [Desulfobacteraceae bacterium]|nr:hypothetical protein [Desulfobacteraceae bacterium]